jgi:hypothetical protein
MAVTFGDTDFGDRAATPTHKPGGSNGPRHELIFVPAKALAFAIGGKLGGGVLPEGSGYRCRCPAHADDDPSLHLVDSESGFVLASCFPCGNDTSTARGQRLRSLPRELSRRMIISTLWAT